MVSPFSSGFKKQKGSKINVGTYNHEEQNTGNGLGSLFNPEKLKKVSGLFEKFWKFSSSWVDLIGSVD